MDHPHVGELERKDFRWSLSGLHILDQYVHLVKDESLRKVVDSVLHLYRVCVEPKRPHFRKCKCLEFSACCTFKILCLSIISGLLLSVCALIDVICEVSPLGCQKWLCNKLCSI